MRHPTFTRKHYAAIASVMAETNNPNSIAANARWVIIRERLADLFAEDNDSFNRPRFIAACEENHE